MISGEKCESVRCFGKEILRASRKTEGFEDVSDRIFSFYDSVAKTATSGAVNKLEEVAKNDFEEARRMGAGSAAFFKRYNYSVFCRAEKRDENILEVTVEAELKKGSENLMYVKSVHIWNISEEYMVRENGIKKPFLKGKRLLKNGQLLK